MEMRRFESMHKLRMNPGTVHRVAQEFRFLKGLLRNEKKWLYQTQASNPERLQAFIRIEFWKHVLFFAEKELTSGYEVDAAVLTDDSDG